MSDAFEKWMSDKRGSSLLRKAAALGCEYEVARALMEVAFEAGAGAGLAEANEIIRARGA